MPKNYTLHYSVFIFISHCAKCLFVRNFHYNCWCLEKQMFLQVFSFWKWLNIFLTKQTSASNWTHLLYRSRKTCYLSNQPSTFFWFYSVCEENLGNRKKARGQSADSWADGKRRLARARATPAHVHPSTCSNPLSEPPRMWCNLMHEQNKRKYSTVLAVKQRSSPGHGEHKCHKM